MTTNSVERNAGNNGSGRHGSANDVSPITVPIHNSSAAPFVIIGIILAIGAAIAINFTSNLPPVLILIGAIGLFVAIAVLQKPELGAYILIFSVFTNLSDLFTEKGLLSINKPMVVLVVLSIFVNYILKTGKQSSLPRITTIEVVLGIYLLSVLASAFVAVDQSKSFTAMIDLLKDVAVGYCIYITIDTKEKVRTGVAVLLGAITVVAILGVIRTATEATNSFWGFAQQSAFGQISDSDGQLRYAGPLGESNIWGQVLVSTIPIAIYMIAKAHEPFAKILPGLCGLFILLAMLFTESRGAMLALAFILILMSIDLRIKGSTFLLFTSGMLLLLLLLPSKYTERLRSLDILIQKQEYGYTSDQSINGRRAKMLTGLSMFINNPFLGVGFANYGDNYLVYGGALGLNSSALNVGTEGAGNDLQPHSLYVEIMAETGLFGILSFLTFLWLILHGLYQVRKSTRTSTNKAGRDWSMLTASIMMSLITFLFAGFFLHGIAFRFIWVLIGLSLAFIYISKSQPPSGAIS